MSQRSARVAAMTILSNTGCGSVGVWLMTRRISAVAARGATLPVPLRAQRALPGPADSACPVFLRRWATWASRASTSARRILRLAQRLFDLSEKGKVRVTLVVMQSNW